MAKTERHLGQSVNADQQEELKGRALPAVPTETHEEILASFDRLLEADPEQARVLA
jgi:hypothetical protein